MNVPEWLFEDARFCKEVDEFMVVWRGDRKQGLEGIVEFNDALHTISKDFL